MRDALSILERCISEYQDILKYEDVVRIIGAIDKQVINGIVEDIINLNSVDAISKLDDIIKKGKDLRQVNYELTEEFLKRLIDSKDNSNLYAKIVDRLSKLDNDLRLTSKPAIIFKACIVEICNYTNAPTNNMSNGDVAQSDSNLTKKISMLENEIVSLKNKINDMKVPAYNSGVSTRTVNTNVAQTATVNQPKELEVDKEKLKLLADSESFKKGVIEAGHIKLYSALASTKIYTDETNVIIVTNNSFAYSILILDENISILKDVYASVYGENLNMYIRLKEEANNAPTNKMESVLQKNNVNYTNLDWKIN